MHSLQSVRIQSTKHQLADPSSTNQTYPHSSQPPNLPLCALSRNGSHARPAIYHYHIRMCSGGGDFGTPHSLPYPTPQSRSLTAHAHIKKTPPLYPYLVPCPDFPHLMRALYGSPHVHHKHTGRPPPNTLYYHRTRSIAASLVETSILPSFGRILRKKLCLRASTFLLQRLGHC